MSRQLNYELHGMRSLSLVDFLFDQSTMCLLIEDSTKAGYLYTLGHPSERSFISSESPSEKPLASHLLHTTKPQVNHISTTSVVHFSSSNNEVQLSIKSPSLTCVSQNWLIEWTENSPFIVRRSSVVPTRALTSPWMGVHLSRGTLSPHQ